MATLTLKKLFYLAIALSTLSSCAFTKAVIYFVPSINDHKIFPYDVVKAKPNPNETPIFTEIPPQQFQLPPLEQWVSRDWMSGAKNIDEFFEKTHTNAFIIVRNDTILYEKYFDGRTKTTPSVAFSVTKAIVATLVSIAADEGLLKFDQSIADFIPEFKNDARRDIKIQHLLNMTEGVSWIDHRNIGKLGLLYYTPNQYDFVVNNTSLKHKPGTHFAYKSMTTQILGMCLEGATKKKLYQYLEEKIWQPIGMESDGLFTKDSKKHGNGRAFGGLALTARDLLRFGKLLMKHGNWNGKQIVSQDFIRDTYTRCIKTDKWWGYSNCFWRNTYLDQSHLDMQDFQAAGFHGQFLFMSPAENIIIVRMGPADGKPEWSTTLGRLKSLLAGRGNDLTNPALDLSKQFEGTYETLRGEKILVVDKGFSKEGTHLWTLYKDINRTTKLQKLDDMETTDGRSIVLRKFGRQRRLMFETTDGKVTSAHYDDLLSIDTKHFDKTGELPAHYKKLSKAK